MTRWISEILENYGQEVSLEQKGDAEPFRAFLQPFTQRDEITAEPFEAGWVDRRLWLYLGRQELDAGDVLLWNGRRFRARSVQPHYIGGRLCHWRAVLERAWEAPNERTDSNP